MPNLGGKLTDPSYIQTFLSDFKNMIFVDFLNLTWQNIFSINRMDIVKQAYLLNISRTMARVTLMQTAAVPSTAPTISPREYKSQIVH